MSHRKMAVSVSEIMLRPSSLMGELSRGSDWQSCGGFSATAFINPFVHAAPTRSRESNFAAVLFARVNGAPELLLLVATLVASWSE